MPILDAALAFALTMLLVATVVTQIVQLLQNLARRRSEEFAKMLSEFHEGELRPVVKREMNRLSHDLEATAVAGIEEAAKKLELEDLVPEKETLTQLTQLSTIELKEVLKRSGLGAELLKKLGEKAEPVFEALGERYDALGRKFTRSFRQHSRRWATGVALVLALAVNIDSLFIASLYIGSETSRNAVIAQHGSIAEGYERLAAELRSGDRSTVTADELTQVIQESQEDVKELRARGLPVGWSYFPHVLLHGGKDASGLERNNLSGWATWIFGILLTAFFAGLGAPFWYDTVTGIARAVQKGSDRG